MNDEQQGEGQLELMPELTRARVREAKARARKAAAREDLAATDPVARVLVDVPHAHLDRPFDYAVPATMADTALPGARVKVRFAGQDVDGFVVDRVAESEHPGRLAPLRRAVSAEQVLTPEVLDLCREVAARYAGTTSDLLRLAVPPRHATTEKRPVPDPGPLAAPSRAEAAAAWAAYPQGDGFVAALADGVSPRAVWSALPGQDWAVPLAHAVVATVAAGRGALVCVPDHRDVGRLDAALREIWGAGHHVVLTADAGPAARYAAFLAASRGTARAVIGTRAAALAPVRNLGLVAVWDDGDDLHAEPRAPYPHVREVLLMRAERQGCAALVGGFARTVEGQYLLETGWATELAPSRERVRAEVRVAVTGTTDRELERDPFARSARLPRSAYDAIREGLEHGPVLLQTPRQGYAHSLTCDRCRTPALCATCHGPLALGSATAPPACRWCGTEAPAWACGACGNRGLRAPVLGEARTAEELGRAFPSVPVRTSAAGRVLATVPATPALVVATPGAEPVAEGGYATVVLLDTWLMLARPDLRTAEESLRRWLNAGALAGRAGEPGRVMAVGDSAHPALQALVRWDPAGAAEREMRDRQSAHLPPASRLATLIGAPGDVDDALTQAELPAGAEVLGPVPVEESEQVRAVVRVPRRSGAELSAALRVLQSLRSARKLPMVRVQVDPVALG